jgi:hypothetical protein
LGRRRASATAPLTAQDRREKAWRPPSPIHHLVDNVTDIQIVALCLVEGVLPFARREIKCAEKFDRCAGYDARPRYRNDLVRRIRTASIILAKDGGSLAIEHARPIGQFPLKLEEDKSLPAGGNEGVTKPRHLLR